jgi:hypothetical protein
MCHINLAFQSDIDIKANLYTGLAPSLISIMSNSVKML